MARYWAENTSFVLQLGPYVFLHGSLVHETVQGIVAKYGGSFFEAVNGHVRKALLGRVDPDPLVVSIGEDRSFSNSDECPPKIDETMLLCGLPPNAVFFCGHTVQKEISPSCEGKIFRLDIAMSGAFGGTAVGVVEIKKGDPEIRALLSAPNPFFHVTRHRQYLRGVLKISRSLKCARK